jgi:hypothetical protein
VTLRLSVQIQEQPQRNRSHHREEYEHLQRERSEFKEVSKEDIDVCKKKKGLNIFEVSAKTGNGVEGAFKTLAEKLIEKNTKGSDKKDKNNGIEITEENVGKGKNKKGGCCGGQKE